MCELTLFFIYLFIIKKILCGLINVLGLNLKNSRKITTQAGGRMFIVGPVTVQFLPEIESYFTFKRLTPLSFESLKSKGNYAYNDFKKMN